LEKTNYPVIPVQEDLRASLQKDNVILIDDGRLQLHVQSVHGLKIWARVAVGGEISSHKGI